MMSKGPSGYMLTDYGNKLFEYTDGKLRNLDVKKGIPDLIRSLSSVPDRYVVGLTYRYYPDSAINPTIRSSVDKLNSETSYGGIPLNEIPKIRFERALREGEQLVLNGTDTK